MSADEAIASLCLHLQGFLLAASQDVPIQAGSLALDAELLRQAGEWALAEEVDDLDAELSERGVEVSFFLNDRITDADREAVGMRLRSEPGLTRVQFETKEEAARRFREMFKDQPIFLENVDVRILPASWRAFASEQDLGDLIGELRGMRGVRSASTEPAGFSEAADEFLSVHSRVCQGSASSTGSPDG